MPRRCTVCDSPHQGDIDAALVTGSPYRDISRRFEATRSAIARHATTHLRERLTAAKEKREEQQQGDSETLLERLLALSRQTLEILTEARRGQKQGLALDAIKRAEAQIRLQGELLGEFKRDPGAIDFGKIVQEAAARARETREDEVGPWIRAREHIKAEIEELKKERDALARPDSLNSGAGPGRPALPSAPAAITPEVLPPEPARAERGPAGWPRPTMRLGRLEVKIK